MLAEELVVPEEPVVDDDVVDATEDVVVVEVDVVLLELVATSAA